MRNARKSLPLLVLGAWHGLIAQVAAEDGWKRIHEEQGVFVSVRDIPGQSLPMLRGVGRVEGPLLHVLAVVLDDSHVSEWAKGADENRVLREIDPLTHIVYSRSHQPWPVHDRDLVMKRSVQVVAPEREYRVHLTCAAGEKPELSGVIRIKQCDTLWVLRKLDDDTTLVDYQVHVDPGGSSPDWLVRAASKNTPLDTLLGLRKQVARTRGRYEQTIKTWSARS
jgi:hypothetical protein